MSVEDNKRAVRRFFDEVWNRGNVELAGEFLAPDFVSHNGFDIEVIGPDGYGQAVRMFRRAFSNFHTTIEDVIAEADRVVVRGTDRGIHSAEIMGHPPTGREVVTTWIEIFRVEGGKAVEGWLETDMKRLLDHLSGRAASDESAHPSPQ